MRDPSTLTPSDALSGVVEAVLQAAFRCAEEGEWDRAAELLTEGLLEDPEDPYLLNWLGLVEQELGLDGLAYERFRRAIDSGSNDPILLATAGSALALFDDSSAGPALRTAALLAPQMSEVRWRYGAYLSREGLLDEALEELDTASNLDPDDPVIQLERGVAQALKGDFASARLSFDRSVTLDRANGWGLVLLGLIAVEEGDLEAAVVALDEGARIRHDDPEAQLLAALALHASGWDDRAYEMLERGRMGPEGLDTRLADYAEVEMESAPGASLEFLKDSLGPSALRERLMVRF